MHWKLPAGKDRSLYYISILPLLDSRRPTWTSDYLLKLRPGCQSYQSCLCTQGPLAENVGDKGPAPDSKLQLMSQGGSRPVCAY